jgi:hypothetical protein
VSKQTYSKAKGRDAENAVVMFLRARGIPAERRRLTGAGDCGDVGGWASVVVEVKAEKRLNLAGAMDELEAEVEAANARFGVGHVGLALCKRRGTGDSVERWYAILPPALAVEAIKALVRERGQ